MCFQVFVAVLALAAVAVARPDGPPRQYEEPSYGPASYDFNWAVQVLTFIEKYRYSDYYY